MAMFIVMGAIAAMLSTFTTSAIVEIVITVVLASLAIIIVALVVTAPILTIDEMNALRVVVRRVRQ